MTMITYRGLALDGFQKKAIEYLCEGESVLVSAPTGTGKTLVADWIVEQSMLENKTVIYTAPIKALSNQKYRDYCALYGEENVGLITGDLVIRRDAPCKVMTTEILRNILLCQEEFQDLKAVIVDEIHFLDDPDRGTTWEEMLIYLPHHIQIVGLSATLQNLEEFAEWLSSVRKRKVHVIEEHKRAVPLSYKIACKQTGLISVGKSKEFFKNRKSKPKQQLSKKKVDSNSTSHLDVFRMMKGHYWPYLYFTFSRAKTENLAFGLKHWLRQTLLSEEEQEQMDLHIKAFKQSVGAEGALQENLEEVLRMGVAFHHAGVHVLLKNLVEELYEKRLIKVLYCTGTFALGINMPAKSAVFDSLERFDGTGMIPLPTREFMQMAGRAGRRGLDESGTVVIRMNQDEYEEYAQQIHGYLSASYEPVISRFSLSFNSVVNLLYRNPSDRIRELVELSFLSWRRQIQAKKEREQAEELQKSLELLLAQHSHPHQKNSSKKARKEIFRKVTLAEEIENKTWNEFQQRVEFLQKYEYIGKEGQFYAGAKVLMFFQIQEIFVTELFLQGILENLSDGLLFGLFCALVSDLPRNVYVYKAPSREIKDLVRDVRLVHLSDIVQQSARLLQQVIIWEPQLISLGQAWAEGKSLAEIQNMFNSATDVSGTLIGAFRRAKDLLSQLRDVWYDIPERREELTELIRLVSRDEVEVVA